MGAEATNLDKYRYHEVFMASGDDIDGPSPWKCGGSMWKFVEVFFSWTHNLSRPVLETYPCSEPSLRDVCRNVVMLEYYGA